MTTFTDKELIKEIKERIGSLDVRDNIERRAYEIALASLEAEPVAWMRDDADGREYNARNEFSGGGGGVPLYATPPAPVVPEEKPMPNPLSMYAVDAVAAIAEVRGWNACRAAMLQSGNFRENKNSSTNNFLEIAETSTNYPVIPSEVLSAILKVAKIRADFDDFDGDRRGIGDCLDEAEQELIVTINKYASQLAVEPVVPAVLERLRTIVADPRALPRRKEWVSGQQYSYVLLENVEAMVDEACHAAMLHSAEPVSQTYKLPPLSSNEVNDAAWKLHNMLTEHGPLNGRQFNNLKGCFYEALKVAMRNYPVTPDGWISCSERIPEETGDIIVVSDGIVMSGISYSRRDGFYIAALEYDDDEPIDGVTHWMPLPEPPQG